MADVDDCVRLPRLSEADVLVNIHRRHARQVVYTRVGHPVLIAVNPWLQMPALYTEAVMRSCAERVSGEHSSNREEGSDDGEFSGPHVFEIAARAYTALSRRLEPQSIVVSGESGAGKTESTKYIVSFLGQVSKMTAAAQFGANAVGGGGAEDKISAAAGPLLEAFGNAVTGRNNNSSRFGKFVKVLFNPPLDDVSVSASEGNDRVPRARMCGARIDTYLLEKSRVTRHEQGDRNFHIFYFLLHGQQHIDSKLRKRLALTNKVTDFRILVPRARDSAESAALPAPGSNQQSIQRRFADAFVFKGDDAFDGSDADHMAQQDNRALTGVVSILRAIGLASQSIDDIFIILSTILHLGNIEFARMPMSDKSHFLPKSQRTQRAVKTLSALLGLSAAEIESALTSKPFTSGSARQSAYSVPLKDFEALAATESLCRNLYSQLFQWLVQKMNITLGLGLDNSHNWFIGCLDIFGFEVFDTNSLEQLNINYANEKLQQLFNSRMIEVEQTEYQKEGVPWVQVGFDDNSDCVQLFEARPMGLLALLDEECRMPKGADASLLSKLHASLGHLSAVEFPNGFQTHNCFVVRHFAANVAYSVTGFLSKNRDTLYPHLTYFLQRASGNVPLLREVLGSADPVSARPGVRPRGPQNSAAAGQSVSSSFKTQLNELVSTIQNTEVQFVRCIKPNTRKNTAEWDADFVRHQLRCGGLIAATRIRQKGFYFRPTFEEFANRFRILLAPLPELVEHARKNDGALPTYQDDRQSARQFSQSLLERVTQNAKRESHTSADVREEFADFALGTSKIFVRENTYSVLERLLINKTTSVKNEIRRMLEAERRAKEEAERVERERRLAEEQAAKREKERLAEIERQTRIEEERRRREEVARLEKLEQQERQRQQQQRIRDMEEAARKESTRSNAKVASSTQDAVHDAGNNVKPISRTQSMIIRSILDESFDQLVDAIRRRNEREVSEAARRSINLLKEEQSIGREKAKAFAPSSRSFSTLSQVCDAMNALMRKLVITSKCCMDHAADSVDFTTEVARLERVISDLLRVRDAIEKVEAPNVGDEESAATSVLRGEPAQVTVPTRSDKQQTRAQFATRLGGMNLAMIGQFALKQRIGRGKFGTVYAAEDSAKNNRVVALKVLAKKALSEVEQQRALHEIEILKKLKHRNIVELFDFVETDQCWAISMELVEGPSLWDYGREKGVIPEPEARVYFSQIVEAVRFCHSRGIVHRDLKNNNMLLAKRSKPVTPGSADAAPYEIQLIDFGMSNFFTPGDLRATFCGTPAYAAPELIRGDPYEGSPVDVWSLGVVLYVMVCAALPFQRPLDILHGRFVPPSEAIPQGQDAPVEISRECADLIQRLLTVDPRKRVTIAEIPLHRWLAPLRAEAKIARQSVRLQRWQTGFSDSGTTPSLPIHASPTSSSSFPKQSLEFGVEADQIKKMALALEDLTGNVWVVAQTGSQREFVATGRTFLQRTLALKAACEAAGLDDVVNSLVVCGQEIIVAGKGLVEVHNGADRGTTAFDRYFGRLERAQRTFVTALQDILDATSG